MNFIITIIVCLSKVDLCPILSDYYPHFHTMHYCDDTVIGTYHVLTVMIIVSLDTYCGYQIFAHPTFNH